MKAFITILLLALVFTMASAKRKWRKLRAAPEPVPAPAPTFGLKDLTVGQISKMLKDPVGTAKFLISSYDKDNTGSLEIGEFKLMIEDICSLTGMKTPKESYIAKLFKKADYNGDGKLSVDELVDQVMNLVKEAFEVAEKGDYKEHKGLNLEDLYDPEKVAKLVEPAKKK